MKRSGPPERRTPLRSRNGLRRTGITAKARPLRSKRRSAAGPTSATRQAVIGRDGSCRAHAFGFALDERCSGGPHIHHRRLRSQGGGHEADNLLLLCDHHHRLAHDHRRAEANETGVIITNEGTNP